MSEKHLRVLIELDEATCEYLANVIADDVRAWDDTRDSTVHREQALALCMFLTDQLEPWIRLRIDIPSLSAAAA